MTAIVVPDNYAENVLAHYGVAGMRWGKRKGSSKESGSKKPKATSQEILEARYRQQLRLQKAQEAQGDFIVARTNKGKDKAEKIMRQREKELFNNPDAEIANKMTKGEKWTTGVLAGLGAASVALSVLR